MRSGGGLPLRNPNVPIVKYIRVFRFCTLEKLLSARIFLFCRTGYGSLSKHILLTQASLFYKRRLTFLFI